MIHNFNKPRYEIVPNRIPKFKVGSCITVNSTQHSLTGQEGNITKVFPAQNNVFYKIQTKDTITTISERMLTERK